VKPKGIYELRLTSDDEEGRLGFAFHQPEQGMLRVVLNGQESIVIRQEKRP